MLSKIKYAINSILEMVKKSSGGGVNQSYIPCWIFYGAE